MAESQGFFERLRSLISSFPRTRESSDFDGVARKSLDSRVRGNDEQKQQAAPVYIAAKRGEPKRRNGAGDGR